MRYFCFCLSLFIGVSVQGQEWRKYIPEAHRGNPSYEEYYRRHYEEWKRGQAQKKQTTAPHREWKEFQPNDVKEAKTETELNRERALVDEVYPWRFWGYLGVNRSRFSNSTDVQLQQLAGPPTVNRTLSANSSRGTGFFGLLGLERQISELFSLRSMLGLHKYYYAGKNLYFSNEDDRLDLKYLGLDFGPIVHFSPFRQAPVSFFLSASLGAHYLLSASAVRIGKAKSVSRDTIRQLLLSALFSLGMRYETRPGKEGLALELFYERMFQGPYSSNFFKNLENEIVRDDANISAAQTSNSSSKLNLFGLRFGYYYNF